MRVKILITDPLSKEGIEKLKEEDDFEIKEALGLKEEELVETIPGYSALIIRSGTKVTRRVIDAATGLKLIGRAGVGVDNVDIDAATRNGIVVMNAPEGNTISAAEHTVSLLLALSRNIPQADASLKKGKWERKKFMGTEISGKVLGIVGLGRIGREVAKRAQGLEMKVIAYDPFISQKMAGEMGVTLFELEELLPQVDYLTLHTPLTSRTKNLIGEREISLMKSGVRIINCARGGIIEENALYQALKNGKVKGAALDVFEEGKPFGSPLLELDSVILTPHLGASTEEAQKKVSLDIALQIIDALKGKEVRNAVNIPVISSQLRRKIGSYLSLCERMGELEAQLVEGHPKEIRISYSGQLANFDLKILTATLIKGLLSFDLHEAVNYVNAPVLAKERGIEVVETKKSKEERFANLISVSLITNKQEKLIEGTVFEEEPHIIKIDDYSLDFIPEGYLLICANIDKPGAVGKIATVLGKHQINIGGLGMSRKGPGGKNVSVYILDTPPPPEALRELSRIEEVLEVKLANL